MANGTVSLPRHWEDWSGLALGLWLCVSPWVLQVADDMPATRNAFLVGLLLVAVETTILSAFEPWEEWITVAIGAWLVVSPWVLGIAEPAALANAVVVGLLVLGLALYEVWEARREASRTA